VPRLIKPVEFPSDLEGLIDLLLGLLEGRGTGHDVERALVGLAHFSAVRPSSFEDLTAPLAARAAERLRTPATGGAPLHGYPEADLALAVLAWVRGPQLAPVLDQLRNQIGASIPLPTGPLRVVEPTPGSFLSLRVL